MNRTIHRLLVACALLWPSMLAAQTAPPGTIEYYHVDALGSVRAVTDANGNVVRTQNYHPFGEGVGVARGGDPMGYTGKPRDAETGLDYFGARYYAQRLGRFTTVDPALDMEAALLDPQRWNRYAYALNAPGTFVDPDGRSPRAVELLSRVAQRLLGSPSVRSVERVINRWSDRLLDVSIRLTVPRSPVVLGETVDRVSAAQMVLRGTRTYNPGEAVTAGNFERIKNQNLDWLRQRLADGGKIFDIGLDPGRDATKRGPFYQAEADLLRSLGYAQRLVGHIEINGEKVALMQWVRVF